MTQQSTTTQPTPTELRRRRLRSTMIFVVAVQLIILVRPDFIPWATRVPKTVLTANVERGEEITLGEPSAPDNRPILHYEGDPAGESIDIQFERATVAPQSLIALAGGGRIPPHTGEPAAVTLTIRGTRKQIDGLSGALALFDRGQPPASISLFQSPQNSANGGYAFGILVSRGRLDGRFTFRSSGKAKYLPDTVSRIQIDPGPIVWRPQVPAGLPIDVLVTPDTRILVYVGHDREHGPVSLTSPVNGRPQPITASSISIDRWPDATLTGTRGQGLRVVHFLGRPSNLTITTVDVDATHITAAATGVAVRRPYADLPGIVARLVRHPVVVLLILLFDILLARLLPRRSGTKTAA